MKTHVFAHDCRLKDAGWLPIVGLAALLAGCGSAGSETLLQNAVRLEAPSLPEGGIFGTAFALEGDLLAVNAESNMLVPEPGSWVGATTIYRRVDGRWVLEDTLHSPASWMIESGVHIFDGQVLMMAPFDGQCLGPNAEPVPQSGSIYAYSWSGQQWGTPEQICAPDPQGNGALGWSSARTQDGLLMASNPQNGAPSLVGLTQADGWRTSTALSLPRFDLSFGLVALGVDVLRVHDGEAGFEVEMRDARDLTQVTRRLPCRDTMFVCRAWPLSQGRVLVTHPGMAEIVDETGAVSRLTLEGAGEHFEVTGYDGTAALLDELGQLFLIEDPEPNATISPALTEFCAEGIAKVGLFAESVLLSCSGTHDVWVVPRSS